MGICFTGNDQKEKIDNAKITKVYIFDNMKLSKLKIDEFTPIENVKLFSATGNYLSELPTLFFDKIKSLIKINLSHNEFIKFDKILFKFYQTLQSIDFSFNQIQLIPNEISSFTLLAELNLSNNTISEIPIALTELINLESLDLSNNKIATIPDNLIIMKKLLFVNISHNKITVIPSNNWEKSQIIKLDLSYNDIEIIPSEILGKSQITRLFLKENKKMTLKTLLNTEGYESYMKRRKSVKDQGFEHDLDISFTLCGLDG